MKDWGYPIISLTDRKTAENVDESLLPHNGTWACTIAISTKQRNWHRFTSFLPNHWSSSFCFISLHNHSPSSLSTVEHVNRSDSLTKGSSKYAMCSNTIVLGSNRMPSRCLTQVGQSQMANVWRSHVLHLTAISTSFNQNKPNALYEYLFPWNKRNKSGWLSVAERSWSLWKQKKTREPMETYRTLQETIEGKLAGNHGTWMAVKSFGYPMVHGGTIPPTLAANPTHSSGRSGFWARELPSKAASCTKTLPRQAYDHVYIMFIST